MLPFAICMNAIPPIIFEKLVVWTWNDSQQHKLASTQASWTRASRNATFLATEKPTFGGPWVENKKTKQGSRSKNRSIADASIQKPDSCARRKPTRPELRIC